MSFAQQAISSQFRKSPSGAFSALTNIRSPKLSLPASSAPKNIWCPRRDPRSDLGELLRLFFVIGDLLA